MVDVMPFTQPISIHFRINSSRITEHGGPVKKTVLATLAIVLALPLAAAALPSETPYHSDCIQPWAKPDSSASDYEYNSWFRLANRYNECLNDWMATAGRNAREFSKAYNTLLDDARERAARGDMTEEEVESVKWTLGRYKEASKAWAEDLDSAASEQKRFARDNNLRLKAN